jgi:hypothetical protein
MKTHTERQMDNAYKKGSIDRELLDTAKKIIADKDRYHKDTVQKSQQIVDNYLKLKKDGKR